MAKILFNKNSVGQRVHSESFGYGTITEYDKDRSYPFLVKFDDRDRRERYTALGEYWVGMESADNITKSNVPKKKELTPQEMIKQGTEMIKQGTEMVQLGLDLLAGEK